MKILLLGEYSNVHATLAEGLRFLGHEVTVVSNGDFWKNYPRDIDVSRRSGKLGGIRLMTKIIRLLPKMKGYDVVQLINPIFFELKAERLLPIYKYLRNNNRRIYLGAFGMDYYWVHENITRTPLRYSDFNIGNKLRTDANATKERRDWIGTAKEQLNKYIANDCDGIVSGLYEYHICYKPNFPNKTKFIPYPIKIQNNPSHPKKQNNKFKHTNINEQELKIFIGISKNRNHYKGTDIMLAAAQAVKRKYPEKIDLKIAEGLPFKEYTQSMQNADVILDQLYSYTPAMNALEAMSHGIIVIGGGENENYEIINEKENKPIINVQPNFDSVFNEIEQLVLYPQRIPSLKQQSINYIRKHHDYIKVARQYEKLYKAK